MAMFQAVFLYVMYLLWPNLMFDRTLQQDAYVTFSHNFVYLPQNHFVESWVRS